MRCQGDVKETGDHGTLVPQRPYVDAAHARSVHEPVLNDVRQSQPCDLEVGQIMSPKITTIMSKI